MDVDDVITSLKADSVVNITSKTVYVTIKRLAAIVAMKLLKFQSKN